MNIIMWFALCLTIVMDYFMGIVSRLSNLHCHWWRTGDVRPQSLKTLKALPVSVMQNICTAKSLIIPLWTKTLYLIYFHSRTLLALKSKAHYTRYKTNGQGGAAYVISTLQWKPSAHSGTLYVVLSRKTTSVQASC